MSQNGRAPRKSARRRATPPEASSRYLDPKYGEREQRRPGRVSERGRRRFAKPALRAARRRRAEGLSADRAEGRVGGVALPRSRDVDERLAHARDAELACRADRPAGAAVRRILFVRSVHESEHTVIPLSQAPLHLPLWHTGATSPHTPVPPSPPTPLHAPQCFPSVWRLTHSAPQRVSPGGQTGAQAPAAHFSARTRSGSCPQCCESAIRN